MSLTTLPTLPPAQPLLATGLTGMSTGVFPTTSLPLITTTAAGQPALGLNSSLAAPLLTNHIAATSIAPPPPALPSSFSPAAGMSPLQPVSQFLPFSPVTAGLRASPVSPAQPLLAQSQPLGLSPSPLGSPALYHSSLLAHPPARRVLLQPSPLQSGTAVLPFQRPLLQAMSLQQQQAMSLQQQQAMSLQQQQTMSLQQQQAMSLQQQQMLTQTMPLQQPVQPVLLQQPQQPALLQVASQPTMLQLQATPFYQPAAMGVQQPPLLVQWPPQHIQVAPSSQILAAAPGHPMLMSSPSVVPPGTVLLRAHGTL